MFQASQRRVVITNLFDKGNIKTEGDDSDYVLTRRSRSAVSQAHSGPVENKIFSQNVMKIGLVESTVHKDSGIRSLCEGNRLQFAN